MRKDFSHFKSIDGRTVPSKEAIQNFMITYKAVVDRQWLEMVKEKREGVNRGEV